MILVVGSIIAAEGKFEQALALSREHVLRSRTEPGCLSHDVHRDVENPYRLVFVEQWSDRTALQAHFREPTALNFVRLIKKLGGAVPQIDIYDANPLRF